MSKLIRSPATMRRLAERLRAQGRRIGFVPTMGYLHAGHASLMREARRRSDAVVVSIFVNPLQFGPGEDLARYPRDLRGDLRLCRRMGVDVVFAPTAAAMYGSARSVYVDEDDLSRGLCGASRPGHFRGVLTVVAKLFNLVMPHVAVFGAKDAQQARLVRRMAADLSFPARVVVSPTVREPDGLAMSSRNAYLSAGERAEALCLSRALRIARRMVRGGERRAAAVRRAMAGAVAAAPSARIDYITLVDDATLKPVKEIAGPTLAALAVRIGATRLIDNAVLRPGAAPRAPSPRRARGSRCPARPARRRR